MPIESLLWVVATLVLAGFLQGLTGFGFGLLAMALLPLLMPLAEAQAVITLTSAVACLMTSGLMFRDAQWGTVRLLLLGSLVGVPIGFAVLNSLSPSVVMRLLGLVLVLLVLFELTAARRFAVRLPRQFAGLIGLVSGILTGALNVGGPPIVAYVYGQPWTKEEQVATLSVVFLTNGLMRLTLLVVAGHMNAVIWTTSAWSIAPMLLAILGGNRALRHISQRHLRAAVYTVLLALGGRYLLAPG